ncbi:MAG: hypothetical protein JWM31_2468, partial [Solirubrobacterales bacterium]|nr:hypothetical protein [Solirubrobacterales bacterium]
TVALSAEGGVDAATWESFSADYDQAQLRIQEVEQDLLDAQIGIEELKDERDRAQAQAQELAKALAFGRPAEVDVETSSEPPTSVVDAVRRAQVSCPALVFLPEAILSAEESQYDDPVRVLADLELLNQIAEEWRQDLLPAGPHEALKVRCNGYRDGVSDTALTAYPTDYRRFYEGEVIMLGPHVARGRGAVTAIMRIYWHQDTARRCMVVGHVGRKLRDNSNRN